MLVTCLTGGTHNGVLLTCLVPSQRNPAFSQAGGDGYTPVLTPMLSWLPSKGVLARREMKRLPTRRTERCSEA